MPILLNNDNHNNSANIGPKRDDRPQLRIFIKDKRCCSITTDINLRSSERVTNFIEKWNVFQDTKGFRHLKNCQDVTQHYEIVTVKRNSPIPAAATTAAIDLEFGFSIDNLNNIRGEHAVLSFFSNEKKEMVFENLAVKPGTMNELLRYQDADQAFCLKSNLASALKDFSARRIFNTIEDVDCTSYTVMVTQAKKEEEEEEEEEEDYFIDDDGYRVYDDSVKVDDSFPSPPQLEASQTTRKYFTNTYRGKETNQTFNSVNLHYTGAPIDIYNIVILYEF